MTLCSPSRFVDEIYYGWVVVAACFLGSLVVFGLSYSFGVFLDPMVDEFERSRSVTTIAFSVQMIVLSVGAVIVGILIDRYGNRSMLAVGGVLLCGGLVWSSQASSIATLILAYGFVTGLGLSIIYVISYATVPKWFDRRVGFASGVASTGLGVGMIVSAPASNVLIERIGWRSSLLVLAGVAAALLMIMGAIIRDEPAADSVPSAEFKSDAARSRSASLRKRLEIISSLARTRSFRYVFASWMLIYASLYVILAHIVAHATDLGLSRATGAALIAIIGVTTILGRVAIGFLADRIDRTRVFAVCSALMGVSTLAVPILETKLSLFGFAIGFGLGYGGNGALLGPLTADHFGRSNLNAVFGLVSASIGLSGLGAPYLAAVGYETMASYAPAFAAAGIAAIAGAGLLLVVGEERES
ncbi:MFS transporter [Natronococcus pandeyae]|uniref:MFS transporter n=1 Tax=Natronococcus pandeyae TaxID=2055836 RepID=A0A8J8Q507_9EURY|nr:MFS transporter [Natronococcus pandeyae]TYL37320.1 MFS transporter [Natronococcus pandeyae]